MFISNFVKGDNNGCTDGDCRWHPATDNFEFDVLNNIVVQEFIDAATYVYVQ